VGSERACNVAAASEGQHGEPQRWKSERGSSHQGDDAYLASHPNENGTVAGSMVPFLTFSRGINDAGHL
jgi:hypothetical protein